MLTLEKFKKQVFGIYKDIYKYIYFEPFGLKKLSDEESAWYLSNKIIPHALGTINGIIYTNSKEALNLIIERNIFISEIDIVLTKDKIPVCSHSPKDDCTYEKFINSKIENKYTPLSLDVLISYMRLYNKLHFLLDIKSKKEEVAKWLKANANDVIDRFIIQIESPREYKQITKIHNFKYFHYNFSVDGNLNYNLKFVIKNKIHTCSIAEKNIKNQNTLKLLNKYNIKSYIYTVDSKYEMQKLLEKRAYEIMTNNIDILQTDDIQIDFVKKNKDGLVKLVEPNFIYNRFDIFYNNQYELIKIIVGNKKYYVPVHIDTYTAKLGLYMTCLPQEAFNKLVDFVFKLHQDVDFIAIKHSLNSYRGLKEGNQWTIELPKSEEEYMNSLGSETRQHLRRYDRKLRRDFNCEVKVFEKDIPSEIVNAYFKFKKDTIGHVYKMSEQQYLQEYQVTKAIVLYLNKEVAAVLFTCSIKDSAQMYFENFSYDKKYSKYSPGLMTIYYAIDDLIKNGCYKLYLAGGDYIYKKQLSTHCDKTYSGIIKRTEGKHILRRKLFQFGQNDTFYFLRLLGLKLKKRKKTQNCPLEINKNTKCLMLCPHPDDEILGAGALMIKYSKNFDCICMGSSGIAPKDGSISAKDRAKLRIDEFHKVMDTIGVKNHWIFETYGIPRFDKQMNSHFDEYCETLKNLKNYDYIFLPHPQDGHHEHRYITNKLFKKIAKKVGVNPNAKIVFYEVWKDIKKPNVFFDTSNYGFLYSKNGFKKYQNAYSKLLGTTDDSLLEWKYKILSIYRSQWKYNSMFSVQTIRTKCLNKCKNPIWKFKVISIKKYI